MVQQKLEKVLSKDFIKGLKEGLRIAKHIAEEQGYEIFFPDVDDMLIERMDAKKGGKKK